MKPPEIFPQAVITLGPVDITGSVITTWVVMLALTAGSYVLTRRLSTRPTVMQEVLEASYEAVDNTVKDILPALSAPVVPIIGTLWLLIGASNLIGLLPGFTTPTADLNTTFAFAVLSFSMTHIFGLWARGFKGYLRHYTEPTWFLLPFNLIAEATRTIALAVRLFGNMLSGELIALILLGIVGFLVPVPFDLLHFIISLIQAYIFGILTLVFIAGGIGDQK